MTTYRLDIPAGQYEGRILADCTTAEMTIPGIGVIRVPVDAVTAVDPPIPAEPSGNPIAVVDLGNAANFAREVWQRHAGEWWQVGGYAGERQRLGRTWADLHARGKVMVLVPDPAADAPALPWTWTDEDGDPIIVGPSERRGHVAVIRTKPSCVLTPDACRSLAALLLRAAAIHEQQEASRA